MSVTPYLSVADATATMAFYADAFGAVEQFRLPSEDGKKSMHGVRDRGRADLHERHGPAGEAGGRHDHARSREREGRGRARGAAKTAGVTINVGPEDMFWGDRFAEIERSVRAHLDPARAEGLARHAREKLL